MTADFDKFYAELGVMRTLNDKRIGLSAEQVIQVADMTEERRAELLTRLVEGEHELALIEHRRRTEQESQ